MSVMVSCKNCGKEFRLRAVKIDSEQSLKPDTFSNVNEVYPNCGEMNTYNQKKHDLERRVNYEYRFTV